MKFYLRMCTAFGAVTLTGFLAALVFKFQFSITGDAFYALIAGCGGYAWLTGPRAPAEPQLPPATVVQLPPGEPAGAHSDLADATQAGSASTT